MSTWTFTCVNHPTYRWDKNKCGGGFIGAGVLAFQGDLLTRLPGAPYGMSSLRLAGIEFWGYLGDEEARDYAKRFREVYTPECSCPMSDLVVVAKEYQPFTEACERFHSPGYAAAPSGRVHKTIRGKTLCGRGRLAEGWREVKGDTAVLDAYKCATCYGKPRQQHLRAA